MPTLNRETRRKMKSSKVSVPKAKIPRAMDEIRKDYTQASALLADAQYQVFVRSKDVQNISEQMLDLNFEAAERNRLDKEAAETTQDGFKVTT